MLRPVVPCHLLTALRSVLGFQILIDLFIVSAVWSPRPQGDSMFI